MEIEHVNEPVSIHENVNLGNQMDEPVPVQIELDDIQQEIDY